MKYLSMKLFVCLFALLLANNVYAQINLNKLKSKVTGKESGENNKEVVNTENEEKNENSSKTQVAQEAQIIFAKKYYPSFDAAKPNAVQEVMDGDSLWMYVKLNQPLKNYVYTQKPTMDDGTVKVLNHFQLGIGPQGDESDYENLSVWVGELGNGNEEAISANFLNKTEFSLCLTAYKKGISSKIFIGLVGNGDAGVWKNEIRFYRGIINAGEDNPALGAGKITANVDNGIPKYRSMWNAYNEVLEKGSAEDNELPAKISFDDVETRNMLVNTLKANGLTPGKVYFVQPWGDYTDQDGNKSRQARMVYTYQKEGRCFFGIAVPRQDLAVLTGNYTPIRFEYPGTGFPITCDKY